MMLNTRYRIIIEMIILGLGIFFLFLNINYYWIAEMIMYFGFFAFIIDFIIWIILKKQTVRVLGIIISILTFVNLLRHIDFYNLLFDIRLQFKLQYLKYHIREIIWFFPSILMIYYSVKLLINKEKMGFIKYVEEVEFKIILGFFLLAIILDFPIFGVHGDLGGGLHGHGFWDAYFHLH
jgi:hypothetical protein